jgi:hypothetical protein
MFKFRCLPILAGVAALGLAIASPAAKADVFDLTADHCSGGCGTSPFGSVTLTQDGTSVDFVVTLFNGNKFANTGAADGQAFKFNITGTVGAVTVTQNVPGQTLAFDTGAFNGDGTGNFSFGIACTTCGGGGSSAFTGPIMFSVAAATISQFISPNNLGNIFVADILSGTTGMTGPVAAVPAPVIGHGFLVLLAIGGVLFGGRLSESFKKRRLYGTA